MLSRKSLFRVSAPYGRHLSLSDIGSPLRDIGLKPIRFGDTTFRMVLRLHVPP